MPAIMRMLPHALLCFSLLLFLPSPCASLSEDGKLLLHIRSTYWIDKYNATGNWDPSHENPCGWYGINCNSFNVVTKLSLPWAAIAGNLTSAICGLSSLKELILLGNNFDGPFPDELLECKSLQKLDLSSKRFAGSLPDRIFQLKELTFLNLKNNGFDGQIPAGFGMLLKIQVLFMDQNNINGTIPVSLCNLTTLTNFTIANNPLYHSMILRDLGNLKRLQQLDVHNCALVGKIPSSFRNLTQLKTLDMSNNSLSGKILSFFGSLTQLKMLDMSMNSLSGKIPNIFSNLRQLEFLNLGNNQLNGEIPASLGNISSLSSIDLSNNQLNGEIPASLGNKFLLYLDLSNNLLSGNIPDEFGNLEWFNLSNNRLWAPIPSSLDYCSQKDRFLGNPELGGGCLTWSLVMLLLVPFLLLIVAFFCIALCYFRDLYLFKLSSIPLSCFKSLSLVKPSGMTPLWKLTNFHSLELDESYILRNLTAYNLIGSGGGGNVYKVTLQNQKAVAVKKIQNVVGSAEFNRHTHQENNGVEVEVDTLGLIRHVNILSLLCYISSEEADFKLLVYEYMPNGSLFDRLHHVREPEMALPWPARYKIAVGAARALSYMHHDCFPPILHRDVKSSNILLDADFEAKIGDFGQSRLLQNLGAEYWVSGYVGSHGYIAPEYAERLKVSEKSDIYSFGVVLLELVSGKKSIDDVEFVEGANIVGWINQTLWKGGGGDKSEAEQRVLDRRILDEVGCNFIQEMLGVLCVGLVCTNRIPSQRPSMRDVVGMLIMCRSTPDADEERIPTPSALVPLSSSSTTPPAEAEI